MMKLAEKSFAEYFETPSIVEAFQTWALQLPEILRIIAYGSRVRGENRPDSDLDIAVEIISPRKDETPFDIWMAEAEKWRMQLQPLVPWQLHLEWCDLNGNTPTVETKIRKGSYVIFERDR